MPKVLNKRTDKIPSDAVYVGRPSKWGNPFQISASYYSQTSRDKAWDVIHIVLEKYRVWLLGEIASGHLDIMELQGKDLVCWCSPLPCHADILLELANQPI